ncbi:FxsA family protein [Marivivens sp. LCG002]|uniref:FxsA family protein n=1 Tax=Marivivens sp. LCG002 TaxID=3051171 RepID=UPI0025551668|nr:FxsA family protein [Marivivens sp. LCG002]WIV50797.1 FxsA family protein [Marivivens sp. LCG002]
MWLLFAFILVPLIEIGLFIQVGGAIGLWPTLAIVLLTAVAGSYLVRSQGARELSNLRNSFGTMRDPSEPLANGAMILFAGALLLTPGFFTDFVGFLLLFPPFRAAAYKWVRSKVKTQSFAFESHQTSQFRQTTIIEGEFEDLERRPNDQNSPSGWTKH